ncbi:UNVERIFIED_CONTAM: hypothetical protein Scaly_1349900 [Sesamum calycinum]|uniref:EF-hand domain-containing protein n=1 Tax=Sesamum calycinum TaxID=2727403 RepID=A0AAW2PK63_9LAMI
MSGYQIAAFLEPSYGNGSIVETFLAEFKRAAENVVQLLKEQPTIFAHSQNTFDGSGIRRLLSNKFELDKTLDSALKGAPRDRNGKISKEYLGVAIDSLAASAGLPPLGAVDQMDDIMNEAIKMFDAGDSKTVKEDEFKKLLTEILGSIMLQLEGNPVSVSITRSCMSQLLRPPPSCSRRRHS